MTIQNVVYTLQEERRNNLPARFPCRAIMVKNISQYCQLLEQLKKINGIRVVRSEEVFRKPDLMPQYTNLINTVCNGEWLILTGVSEYLRMFSKKEASDLRFASLWKHKFGSGNMGRLIIPLWGCEAQWFDVSIGLNQDIRQDDYYIDCVDADLPDQQMDLVVLSDDFKAHFSEFRQNSAAHFSNLKEYFEWWENPDANQTNFVLMTKRYGGITSIDSNVRIGVINNILTFIHANMPGSEILTADNCCAEMQQELFPHAKNGTTLEQAILRSLNIASFSAVDIMGKWTSMSRSQQQMVALWYQLHPDSSYLNHCIRIATAVDEIPSCVLHQIFAKRKDHPEWVQEFKSLIAVTKCNLDTAYFEAVDTIPDYEDRLVYLTNNTRDERIYLLKMVGQWLRHDSDHVKICNELETVFPELVAYLSHNLSVWDYELSAYFTRYKKHKLENTLPENDDLYFTGVEPDTYDRRFTVLSNYMDDQTVFLWIDALGVEWLPLLHWGIEKYCSGTIQNVAITQANLPTETCFNEQWKQMDVPHAKLDKLDKLAHKGVVDEPDYYSCIEEQFEFVAQKVSKKITELFEGYQRVVITGDHGTSRLAGRFFHNRQGLDAPKNAPVCSHGRYCIIPEGSDPVLYSDIQKITREGETYAVFKSYNHFKSSGFAAGAKDEEPIYGEVHGGATPEEMLVPVIVVESNTQLPLAGKWEKDVVKIMAKKARLNVEFNRSVSKVFATMGGIQGEVNPTDNGKKWRIVFPNVKEGLYSVTLIADNCIVAVPDIKITSAMGSGRGDLG